MIYDLAVLFVSILPFFFSKRFKLAYKNHLFKYLSDKKLVMSPTKHWE